MSGSRTLLAHKPYLSLRLAITSITTAAWTELVAAASMTKACTAMTVDYSGDATLYLGVGASGSEVALPILIPPGGLPLIPIELSRLTRLSLKAVDQNITDGVIILNLFG